MSFFLFLISTWTYACFFTVWIRWERNRSTRHETLLREKILKIERRKSVRTIGRARDRIEKENKSRRFQAKAHSVCAGSLRRLNLQLIDQRVFLFHRHCFFLSQVTFSGALSFYFFSIFGCRHRWNEKSMVFVFVVIVRSSVSFFLPSWSAVPELWLGGDASDDAVVLVLNALELFEFCWCCSSSEGGDDGRIIAISLISCRSVSL